MSGLSGWIVGPQLIGFIFLVVGLAQMYYPPKKINNYYGYRLPSAMKNQQTWDEANRFSAICMVRCALVIFVVGIIITVMLKAIIMPYKIRGALRVMFLLMSSVFTMPVVIGVTERHMEKTFNNKDEIR